MSLFIGKVYHKIIIYGTLQSNRMIRKLLKAVKNIKVVNRFLISYSVLIFIVITSWVFSYTTTKQLGNNLQELNTVTLSSYFAINDLKNEVNYNLFSCYDYISTNNPESLENYYASLDKITEKSSNVFQPVRQTGSVFNSDVVQQKIDGLNQTTADIIALYQSDPTSPLLKDKISSLIDLRNSFTQLLKGGVDTDIQSKVAAGQTLISDKIEQVTIYLILVVIFIVVVTILLLIFMHYNITTPVNTIKDAAIKFGQGELVKIDMDSKDELGILSNAFNKMVEDISATQKDLHDELAKTKEIDNQKSEFLSIAAHQLRTPMSGLKWLLNITIAGDLGPITEKQKHLWQNGLDNIDRMIKLINDFLDIAKIEQAKFQYKFEKIQIKEIINEVIRMMQTKMDAKNITLLVNEQGEIPAILIDKEKMKIAFTNLIDNAIKYSAAHSSVAVDISADATNVEIVISDQGYGIPTKDQKFIFTKFFRSPNILKKETSLDSIGTGLGLYIVKDIIVKHSGIITFQSEENKGTSFFMKLPLRAEVASRAEVVNK